VPRDIATISRSPGNGSWANLHFEAPYAQQQRPGGVPSVQIQGTKLAALTACQYEDQVGLAGQVAGRKPVVQPLKQSSQHASPRRMIGPKSKDFNACCVALRRSKPVIPCDQGGS
jgi:hypothetical protein